MCIFPPQFVSHPASFLSSSFSPSSPSHLFSLLHWFYSFTHAPACTQPRKRQPQGWAECGAGPDTNEEEFQLKLALQLFKWEEDNLRCGLPFPVTFSLDSLQLPAHCIHLLYSLFEGHYRILSCSYARNLGVALYPLFVCVHNRFLLPWYLRSWRFMSLCVCAPHVLESSLFPIPPLLRREVMNNPDPNLSSPFHPSCRGWKDLASACTEHNPYPLTASCSTPSASEYYITTVSTTESTMCDTIYIIDFCMLWYWQ